MEGMVNSSKDNTTRFEDEFVVNSSHSSLYGKAPVSDNKDWSFDIVPLSLNDMKSAIDSIDSDYGSLPDMFPSFKDIKNKDLP